MRISKAIMIYILLSLSLPNILAQNSDNTGLIIQKKTNSNFDFSSFAPQNWDLKFSYNLYDLIGSSQYAGIVYEASWDELWISSWARGDIEIMKLSDTSIYRETNNIIDGVSFIRGMTTDGEYVYAGNASDTIKILDFYYNLIGEIIAPVNVRYISYDPDADGGNGGFWVGSWTTDPTLIDKNGNFLKSLDYTNLGTSSIYGGAYDVLSEGGPFLWLWGRGLGGGNPQNIVQIDPTTGFPTGVYHDVTADIGVLSDSLVSGGLFITDQLFTGQIILGGILQGSGDYVFGYDISSLVIITTPPSAVTNAATNIGTTTATLNGTINPNGLSTNYFFSYGTSTLYDNFDLGIFEINGNDPIQVTANISGLTPNTLYHFELGAGNDAGDSYGGDLTFTTAVEGNQPPITTTNAATSIGTTTATFNGTINPNGTNTTYYFEYGTSISYGSTRVGSSSLNGTTNVNVSENISGLISNTDYHYRLVATNSGGTTNGNDIMFTTNSTTTGNANLILTKLLPSAFSWEKGSSINVDLTTQNIGSSTANQHVTQLYLSIDNNFDISDILIGNPISFPALAPGDTISMSEIFTVPDVPSRGYFLMAGIDVNNSVIETDENNVFYNPYQIVLGYPSSIEINNNFTFADPTQSSSYRMIGLPGNNNISIASILPGTSGENWIAYHDNGTISDYLVEYDGTSTFNFGQGRGFWVLSKSAAEINRTNQAATLEYQLVQINSSQVNLFVTPITLHNEWNIITNPFEIDISWAEIQAINNISVSLHSFNGNFSASSLLQPYKGYYFNNVTNLDKLFIPYSPNQSASKGNLLSKELATESIIMSVKTDKEIKSYIQIGFNDFSKIGYDSLDRFIPPGDFEDSRISIYNPNLVTGYKYLSKDFRTPNENHIYEIEIKYPIGGSFDLIIDGIRNTGSYEAYLVGPNVNFVTLDSKSTLQLISSQNINKYTLLIGSDEFIENQRDELLPKSISLSQNYPNPFNPSTTIVYSIPEKSDVQLLVYDILGKEIASIVNGEYSAGKYEILFDASELTSGIYFYTLRIGNFIESKKMVLLK